MRKTLLVSAIAVVVVMGTAATAWAVTASMGNAVIDRATRDTFTNFTIVDTNNPAPFDGTFQTIGYYAERVDTIRFVVVDPSSEVTWVSEEITPVSTGVNGYTAPAPVGVVAGSNLGVYSKHAGVVSFDYDVNAAPAPFEQNNAGLPQVGEILSYQNDSARFYSMRTAVTAASPEVCKNGGWDAYGYSNQGRCIASVVANERAGR